MSTMLSWAKLAALRTFSSPTADPPYSRPQSQIILPSTRTHNRRRENCDECYSEEDHYYNNYDEDRDFSCGNRELRPAISTNVPSLKDMSSSNVAISLWCHLNIPAIIYERPRVNHGKFGCLLCEKVLESVEKLSAPKSVADQITKHVILVKNELEDWVGYLCGNVFFYYKRIRYVYSLIYYIVWYPDGTIDDLRTVRMLLTCDRLSNIDKYHLLCIYCWEEEIESVAANLLKHNMFECVKFTEHPLIFYWNCHFKNELERIPVPKDMSIDEFMFNHRGVNNWPAKEYFFEFLSSSEQIQNVISFIDKHDSEHQTLLTLLLAKLNETQRLYVFMEKAVVIMKHYADASNTKSIICTWHQIRNLVNRDQFVSIFQLLFANKNIDNAILKDVWINASDEFKEHLLKIADHKTIVKALERSINDDEIDIFSNLILNVPDSIKNTITKEPFFSKYCVKLMILERFPLLDNLLGVYFPTEEDAIRFKTYLKEDFFISYSQELIKEGKLDLLNRLVHLFIPSADESTQFKQNLTKQQLFREHCEKLIYHISRKFAQPAQLEDLLNSLLAKPELVLEFKKDFVNNYSSATTRRYILSCFGYGTLEDLNNFIDDVFDEMLKGCIFSTYDSTLTKCKFRSDYGFASLDRFLKWCYPLPAEIREYKLRRVDSHMEIDAIRTLLKKKKDNEYLTAVMKWFFQGNAADIDKFKMKNRGRKILMFL